MTYPVGPDGEIDFPVGAKLDMCKKSVKHGLGYCCFPKSHANDCNYFHMVPGGIYRFEFGMWAYYHPYWVKLQHAKKKSMSDPESEMWDE